MNEIIQVNYDNDKPTIVGRELHEKLQVKTKYIDWFNRMCEYGFTEGLDYFPILRNRSDGLSGKPLTDHQLSVGMAKELCMLQRSDIASDIRKYFISIEEQWNKPEVIMARALQMSNKQLLEVQNLNQQLEVKNAQLETKIEEDKPKVEFADIIKESCETMSIGDFARLLKSNGMDVGQQRLFKWLRENGFLIKRQGESYNHPTQKSLNQGLLEMHEYVLLSGNAYVPAVKTTVTGRGQLYFTNIFRYHGTFRCEYIHTNTSDTLQHATSHVT